MSIVDYLLPLPKYELSRYSTKRLFEWHEQAFLVAITASIEADKFPEGSPMHEWFTVKNREAIEFAGDLYMKLAERGVDYAYLAHRYNLLREDVESGN